MNVSMLEVLELLEIDAPARTPGHIQCVLDDHADDTASLCIYDDGWWCYGCGRGGSPFDFLMVKFGCTFLTALRYLESGIPDIGDRPAKVITPKEPVDLTEAFAKEALPWREAPEALAFVAEKWPHLSLVELERWGIVPGGRGRYLMIPHTDVDGRIVGIKTRTVAGPNKGAKRSFEGSTYPRLYRVVDRPEAKVAWLCEGESDTWTQSHRSGLIPDIAVYGLPSGAQTWRPAYGAELARHSWVCVMLDNDDTGNAAADRLLLDPGREWDGARVPPPRGYKDFTEAYMAGCYSLAPEALK